MLKHIAVGALIAVMGINAPASAIEARAMARVLENAAAQFADCEVWVDHIERFFPGADATAIFYRWGECGQGNASGAFAEFYDFEGNALVPGAEIGGAWFEAFDNQGSALSFDLITWGEGDPRCCPDHVRRVTVHQDGGKIQVSVSVPERSASAR